MLPIRRIALAVTAAAALAVLALSGTSPARAQDYDLNFTLPTAGKSGCMVCHADKNLVRLRGSDFVSYWVDGAVLDASAHAKIMCTGCHVDFAYKAPHNIGQTDWRRTAKLSCKNCHKEAFEAYSKGSHSVSTKPGEREDPKADQKPLCGDCHGGHDIWVLKDNPAGKAQLHARGFEVCGKCHKKEWLNYDDYYHGAAFKKGAPDAPSCWQCHGSHDLLPSDDRRALTNEAHLVQTCGQCHPTANEEYVAYSKFIHGKQEELERNPAYSVVSRARQVFSGFLSPVRSLFGGPQ